MKRSLLAGAVLLLLTAGCVQRNNIFLPAPAPAPAPQAHVVVPPTLTPLQQDCLAGFSELVAAGAGSDQLRAWANAARQREGCGQLRLYIDGRPAEPPAAAATDSAPANETPTLVLLELPPTPPPQADGPEIHLVERQTEVTVTQTVPYVKVLLKTALVKLLPPPCPTCGECPDCAAAPPPQPQSGAGGSVVQMATGAAVGGGLAYALIYFNILSVPGLSSPSALQSGDLPEQSEAAAVAAAAGADDLADPRVRVRSAQLGEWSG